MRIRRVLVHRLKTLFRRRRVEDELQRELEIHIEQLAREFMDEGMQREDALLAARREFGSIGKTEELCRDTRRTRLLDEVARDIVFAIRTLRKSPAFTLMALASLALGIGANTAIYSFMDTILVRALPVYEPENLVVLNWRAKGWPAVVHSQHGDGYRDPDGMQGSGTFPFRAWELLRKQKDVFQTVFAFANASRLNVVIRNQAYLGNGEYVSGNYFSGVRVRPALGRLIDSADDRAGAAATVVLSYRYWQRAMAGDPTIAGETILLNRKPFTVIGVAAPEFFGLNLRDAPDFFLPLHTLPTVDLRAGSENWFLAPDNYWVEMMARLRPGWTRQSAEARVSGVFHNFVAATARNQHERANLPQLWLEEGGSGLDSLRRQYSKPLYVLISMTGFILAIACANLANLLLARSAARKREIAVRLSLGAGRWRVIRQLLTESMFLAVVGGLLGLLVAGAGVRFLSWLLANGQDDFRMPVAIDLRILLFAILLSLATGMVFGLAPALEATRLDVTPALKEMRASHRVCRYGLPFGLSHVLVVGQIALSLLLVIASGLFVTTLARLHSVSLGFNKANLLVFNLNAQKAGYDETRAAAFYESLRKEFAAIPGVGAATMSSVPLASGPSDSSGLILPGVSKVGGKSPGTSVLHVGPAFFTGMQIPILLGRAIDEHDSSPSLRAVVVNQVFAKRYLAGRNPIGQHFAFNFDRTLDCIIVGVAKDARYASLTSDTPPVTYLSWAQPLPGWLQGGMYFELRTFGDPLAFSNTVRQIVHRADPQVPASDFGTQTRYIDGNIASERTFAHLCTCFGTLALLIACVGLYGTTAYAVTRRTNEIGIRMALGAQRTRIVSMVMAEVLAMIFAGLAIGTGLAWQGTRAVASFLYGVRPHDVFVFGSSALALAVCIVIAGAAPAFRASRIDPMQALRHE